jgi:hypothetical protein
MNVTELIDTISQFAFGTLATERQRREYLRCLNFANNDIYLKLRNYKEFLIYKEQKVTLNNLEYSFAFDFKSNRLRSVYNYDVKLSSFDLLTNDSLSLTEKQYYIIPSENKVVLGCRDYPKDTDGDSFVKIFQIPKLKTLVETINNANIESDTIIYDEIVTQTLVLGAVYYIFLTTNGQMTKLSTVYTLYKEKLSDIVNFYTSV